MPTNPNLKHVYDNSNKVTGTGLSVAYRQSFNRDGNYWEVVRTAKKQYQFIGMDRDTAYECAAAKRSQYTREFSRIIEPNGQPEIEKIYECPSDIAPQHQDGDVWSVSISVNEIDYKFSRTKVSDPASLFVEENARNYDEDAGLSALSIDSVSRSTSLGVTALTISYSTAIANFDASRLVCEVKMSESSTSWARYIVTEVSSSSVRADGVPESGQLFVRLVYGSIESNTATVE